MAVALSFPVWERRVMKNLHRLVLPLAVALLASMAVSAAAASDWHSNKGISGYTGAFNGSAGRFAISGSVGPIFCNATTQSGNVVGTGSASGVTYASLPAVVVNGTSAFNSALCPVGGVAYTFTCSGFSLSALSTSSYIGGSTYGASGAGTASGLQLNLSPPGCFLNIVSSQRCVITGSVGARHTNPNPVASGTNGGWEYGGSLGSSLTAVNGSGGICPMGTGAVTLSGATVGSPWAFTDTDPAPQFDLWFGT